MNVLAEIQIQNLDRKYQVSLRENKNLTKLKVSKFDVQR
jgi:hypothetical protein